MISPSQNWSMWDCPHQKTKTFKQPLFFMFSEAKVWRFFDQNKIWSQCPLTSFLFNFYPHLRSSSADAVFWVFMEVAQLSSCDLWNLFHMIIGVCIYRIYHWLCFFFTYSWSVTFQSMPWPVLVMCCSFGLSQWSDPRSCDVIPHSSPERSVVLL